MSTEEISKGGNDDEEDKDKDDDEGSGGSNSNNFKLDISCVERDEARMEFLQACARLDIITIRSCVESRGVCPSTALDASGQNGLHYAVCSPEAFKSREQETNRTNIVKYLLRHGAKVDQQRTTDGWSALFLAVIFGHRHLVKILLNAGARSRLPDNDNQTPEDWADKYNMVKIKNQLVHSRSRVQNSRFSCVLQGPPLQPSQSVTSNSSTASTASSSSAENSISSPIDSERPKSNANGGGASNCKPEDSKPKPKGPEDEEEGGARGGSAPKT